jgi:hypothetical protein
LGTCIATEALLKEGQKDQLRSANLENADKLFEGIKKIKFIFTFGSPIDRIFYLFQTDSTFSHRYNRLLEEQRLSISLPPFRDNEKIFSDTKILNFWSRFDPISSQIYSLRKSIAERKDAIVNIEAFPSGFPFPIGTHTSYFSDRNVMKQIYWAIMTGRLPNEPLQPNQSHLDWLGRGGLWLIVLTAFTILSLTTVTMGGLLPAWSTILFFSCYMGVSYFWKNRTVKRYRKTHGPFLQR